MLISIDDRGHVTNGPILAPVTLRSATLDAKSLQDFLVRNLGHIILTVRPHGIVLRWRPEIVSQEALAALLFAVHDIGISRILLQTFDGHHWKNRIVHWQSGEFSRLIETETLGVPPIGIDWAMRRRASRGRVSSSAAVQRLLKFWRMNRAKPFFIDQGELRAMLNQVSENRYCVVHASNPGQLTITAVGSGFMPQIENVLLPCVGHNLTSLPDARFGHFCAKAYGEAAESSEPTIEEIDTFISDLGRRPIRRRYVRAIFPIRTAAECWLLGVSIDDPSINLRVG